MAYAFVLFLNVAFAQPVTLAPLGKHYPVLVLEKNENPQNLLVAYVQLDKECRFLSSPHDDKQPMFDYYWLMDGARYKPVHPMIKSGIGSRLKFKSRDASGRAFTLRFTDLRELQQDLHTNDIQVLARREGVDCAVEAHIELGPSDGHRILRLSRIYSESSKSFLPPFRKIRSVRLKGVLQTGSTPFARTYPAL